MTNTVLCIEVAVTFTVIVNENNAFIFRVIILPYSSSKITSFCGVSIYVNSS